MGDVYLPWLILRIHPTQQVHCGERRLGLWGPPLGDIQVGGGSFSQTKPKSIKKWACS